MTAADFRRRIEQLVATGKSRGYVQFGEIDDPLPEDYAGGPEIDDILSELHRAGVEILEERVPLEDFSDTIDDPDDPVGVYLREVVPFRAADGEIDVGQGIQPGELEAENLRKRLIEANLLLVVSIAGRYANRGVHVLDLIQEGNRALLEAVYKFDPARGYRFSTYATWCVCRAVSHSVSRSSFNIQ